jgi:hypothetical protein
VLSRVEREWGADEGSRDGLAVDLQRETGRGRGRHLDRHLGDERLHLRQLVVRLVDGALEGRRRPRRQRRADEGSVGFHRLDQLAQTRLALGDAEQVRRRREGLLGALELLERRRELPLVLQLVALLEEIAGDGALCFVHLRPRGRRSCHQGEGEREGEKPSHEQAGRGRSIILQPGADPPLVPS